MKVFPFYTSTGQRDDERVASNNTLLCPTWKFLPFQIQRTHVADTFIQSAALVDCDGGETDVFKYFFGAEDLVNDWENGPNPTYSYVTFNDDGAGNILTAIESGAANSFCYSNEFSLATGESIVVNYDLTLNSGTLPNIYLGEFMGPSLFSAKQVTAAGGDIIQLTATGNTGGAVRLMVENEAGNNTSFACEFVSASRYVKRTNLVVKEFTSYDFATYNGEPLNTTLPYGVYYLKIADGLTTWYSEWFSVQNLQPQLIADWPSDNYDTFINTGPNIGTAIASGTAAAYTNSFPVHADEKFIFTYDLTQNSGSYFDVALYNSSIGRMSNIATGNPGLGEIELTATKSSTAATLRLRVLSASSFALGSVSLRRKSGEYVHLEFTNTKDFNNGAKSIYYAGGFTQQVYLDAYENLPSHETIQVGDDKNGEFISEKLVSRYVRSVVSYESRTVYNALRLLPLHDSIKILDEVGIEHTPNAGNVDVNISWDTFDTGTLKLAWTEDNQYWTNSMDNLT